MTMTSLYILLALAAIGFVVYYLGKKKGLFSSPKKEEGSTDSSSLPPETPEL